MRPTLLRYEIVDAETCPHCGNCFSSADPPYVVVQVVLEHPSAGDPKEYTYTEDQPWHGACVIAANAGLPREL